MGNPSWAGIVRSVLKAAIMGILPDPDRAGPAAVTVAVCLITEALRSSAGSHRTMVLHPRRGAVMDEAVPLTELAPAGVSMVLRGRQTMAAHSAATAARLATGIHQQATAEALWAFHVVPTTEVAARALWEAAISEAGQDPGAVDLTATLAPQATERAVARSATWAAARGREHRTVAAPWVAQVATVALTMIIPAGSSCAGASLNKATAVTGIDNTLQIKNKKGIACSGPFFIWQSFAWRLLQFLPT